MNWLNISKVIRKRKRKKRKNNELALKENELIIRENEIIIKENEINKKIEDLKKEKEPIIIGLNNIGATCYMNATLQSLSSILSFLISFLKFEKIVS